MPRSSPGGGAGGWAQVGLTDALLKRQKLEHVIRYTNSSTFVELCVTNIGLVSEIRKTNGSWADTKNKVHK